MLLCRDAYHPVMQLGLGVQYLLSADWPAANLPAVVTTDNGFLHVRPQLMWPTFC